MTHEFEIEIDHVEPHLQNDEQDDLLRTGIIATLHHQGIAPPGTVALLITDDAAIQAMNKMYRGYDKPTDVLSFPDGAVPYPGGSPHLGDIAISLPYATRQAEKVGHGVAAELQLLAVHGTLHLLGHDHADADEKAIMWQAQDEILAMIH